MSSNRMIEKFIVGYFSSIGLWVFCRFFSFSFSNSPFLSLISVFFYFIFLYRAWRNLKLIFAIVLFVGITVSFPFFGSLFYGYPSFTPLVSFISGLQFISVLLTPVWVGFGLVCFIYALITGLLKNSSATSASKIKISKSNNLLKLLLRLSILFSCFFGLLYTVFFGFRFPPCEYTHESLSIPEKFQHITLTLESNAYHMQGTFKENHCNSLLKNIPDVLTYAQDFPVNPGRTIKTFKPGARFTLDQIIADTLHGIATVDTGSFPTYTFILKDEQGYIYKMSEYELVSDFETKYEPTHPTSLFTYSKEGVTKNSFDLDWQDFQKKRDEELLQKRIDGAQASHRSFPNPFMTLYKIIFHFYK